MSENITEQEWAKLVKETTFLKNAESILNDCWAVFGTINFFQILSAEDCATSRMGSMTISDLNKCKFL